MSVKLSIFKSSADGEQTNIEYTLEKRDYDRMSPHRESIPDKDNPKVVRVVELPGESLRSILAPYFKLVDDRLLEMNLRIMVAQKMVKDLPPEAQMAFHNLMEVLHGARPHTTEWADIMKNAVAEVKESLVKQGYNEEAIRAGLHDLDESKEGE